MKGWDIIDLPVHWSFLFQTLVLVTILLVMVQIRTAAIVDELRNHNTNKWMFLVRRGSLFTELLALLWAVVYAYDNGWTPWPPVILFMGAFDVHIVTQIMVMRADIQELQRSKGGPSRMGSRSHS